MTEPVRQRSDTASTVQGRQRWGIASAGFWLRPLGLGVIVLMALGLGAVWEFHTSTLQAYYMVNWANKLNYEVQPGFYADNQYPRAGPLDERLGYTRVPVLVERLGQRNFEVVEQARQSPALGRFVGKGFFAPYSEKTQAGLELLDCRGEAFFKARFPLQVYDSRAAIPPLVAQTLSFIENRELLAPVAPRSNPALEWKRLGRAVLDRAANLGGSEHPTSGGSTLATQLEKFRHSPQGRTAGVHDKYRQMVSASVRAYQEGADTGGARQRILLDYLNSLPLGAQRGHGEVIGLMDGLRLWWGADPLAANVALSREQPQGEDLQGQASAYRQVLALLIAQRRPSYYLGSGQPRLAELTDSYLRVLAQADIISPELRDAALATRLTPLSSGDSDSGDELAGDRKAANIMRIQLASLLETRSLYELDRMDLLATGTIDGTLQAGVSQTLRRLAEPQAARQAGLVGFHLLEPDNDTSKLAYSFTLYESVNGVNRLRAQTDSLNQPFDINTGAKLELGSTAKLRTLTSYLELIAALHARLSPLSNAELASTAVPRGDHLTLWAQAYLRGSQDKSLEAMLEAALQRRYSANPHESFFTGGGVHTFENFEPLDNGRNPTVAEGLRDSINMVFIRLMRDVVQHTLYASGLPVERILADAKHPARAVLLARFADDEGTIFMRGYYRRHQGLTPEDSLALLLAGAAPTPLRLAALYRVWLPQATLADYSAFVARRLQSKAGPGQTAATVAPEALRRAYLQAASGRYGLADLAFIAKVNPLELWVAQYLHQHPEAGVAEVLAAGRTPRQDAYRWLTEPKRSPSAQNTRILPMLEREAFAEIQKTWARLGYPFETLVPSLATALGSSGDRPAALAELMGIIVNDGVRQPTLQLENLRLASGTPFETLLQRKAGASQRAMAPEVAQALRGALTQVVELGTARRLRGALHRADGGALAVGGKTGTGDNRFDTFNKQGGVTASRVINRTATFVFFIGPRHFGTMTVFVPGADAEDYSFTSALPVQVVKHLAPLLNMAVAGSRASACSSLLAQPSPAPEPTSVIAVAAPPSAAPEPRGAQALPFDALAASLELVSPQLQHVSGLGSNAAQWTPNLHWAGNLQK